MVEYIAKGGKEGHLDGLSGVKCLDQHRERKTERKRDRQKEGKKGCGNVESKYKEEGGGWGILEAHQEFAF